MGDGFALEVAKVCSMLQRACFVWKFFHKLEEKKFFLRTVWR